MEFKGTPEEAFALTLAVSRVCLNKEGVAPDGDHCGGITRRSCAAHKMLLDQHTVDRLPFMRRTKAALYLGETVV